MGLKGMKLGRAAVLWNEQQVNSYNDASIAINAVLFTDKTPEEQAAHFETASKQFAALAKSLKKSAKGE